MPTGVSRLYRPIQPEPAYPLELDDSYFLIKLHDAQAFFSANFLQQANFLLVSSLIEGSFSPGDAIRLQSLHKHRITTLRREEPCRLGILTNFTSWLPARGIDTLRITLTYTVTRGTPIKTFVEKMEELQFGTVMSLIRPDLDVAIKISQVVGLLLSHLLQEGEQTEIFPLTMDLNLADLQAGYYAVLGALTNEMFPDTLEIRNGSLTQRGGRELSRYSYVVIQVQTRKRLGAESIRSTVWGELLQACKDKALGATIRDKEDREEAFQKWLTSLEHVRILARKDRSVLETEIDAVIAKAQAEVEQKLFPRTTKEAHGLEAYPDEWQQVLGFSTPQELQRAVRDYQDAVELSERLVQQYQESGS